MDNLRFYGFFSFSFFYIIPVISGRWEKDNIKLCAMEPLPVHVLHVSSEEKVASMCVFWVRAWRVGMVGGPQGFDI